jgi:hypothetical protein
MPVVGIGTGQVLFDDSGEVAGSMHIGLGVLDTARDLLGSGDRAIEVLEVRFLPEFESKQYMNQYMEILFDDPRIVRFRANKSGILYLVKVFIDLYKSGFSGRHWHFDITNVDICQVKVVFQYFERHVGRSDSDGSQYRYYIEDKTGTGKGRSGCGKEHGFPAADRDGLIPMAGAIEYSEDYSEVVFSSEKEGLFHVIEGLVWLYDKGRVGACLALCDIPESPSVRLLFEHTEDPWGGTAQNAVDGSRDYGQAVNLILSNSRLIRATSQPYTESRIKELQGTLGMAFSADLRAFLLQYGSMQIGDENIELCFGGKRMAQASGLPQTGADVQRFEVLGDLLPILSLGDGSFVCLDYSCLNDDNEPSVVLFEEDVEANAYTVEGLSGSFGEFFLDEVQRFLKACQHG